MNADTPMELLRKQPFVQGMKEHEVEQLGKLAKEVRHPSDHVLFGEGAESAEFYLIVSGTVALEITPPTGAFRVDTLGAGDEFGWSAVMGHGTMFQARVLQDLHAIAFDAAELRALCEKDSAFGYQLMKRVLGVVADRLQATRLLVTDSRWPVAKRAGA